MKRIFVDSVLSPQYRYSYSVKFVLAVFSLAAIIAFEGCSLFYTPVKLIEEKPFYESSGYLEFDYFHSPIGDIAGRYPKGWLQVNIEHIQELENVAFVYTDSSRKWVLTLEEISGSADLRRRYELNGLLAIAEESINLHRGRMQNIVITRAPEVFKQNRMRFANYEITRATGDSLTHGRYVVFTTGIRYYELGMIELQPHPRSESYLSNYRLLQSVISSLEGVPTVKE